MTDLPDKISALYTHLQTKVSDLEARWIIEKRAGFDFSDLIARGDESVPADALALIADDLAQFLSGRPLSKIYGEREFYGRVFKVSEDVLDPRPDTETLIDAVLDRYKDSPPKTILDLGTGSGCILITILKEFPNARGVAVDLSEAALGIARENARRHDLE